MGLKIPLLNLQNTENDEYLEEKEQETVQELELNSSETQLMQVCHGQIILLMLQTMFKMLSAKMLPLKILFSRNQFIGNKASLIKFDNYFLMSQLCFQCLKKQFSI